MQSYCEVEMLSITSHCNSQGEVLVPLGVTSETDGLRNTTLLAYFEADIEVSVAYQVVRPGNCSTMNVEEPDSLRVGRFFPAMTRTVRVAW